MNFLKTIFCGVLIATAVSTLSAMDGEIAAIDCFAINTKEALINALKNHGYIDEGFSIEQDWEWIPECVNGIWKRLDQPSKKSILDAYARINRSTTYETPGAPARLDGVKSRDEQLIAALNRKSVPANDEPTKPIAKASHGKRLQEWIRTNKWKSAGIGIITLGAIDALQAYARVDKVAWKESDLKGKAELIRRKMLCTRVISGTYGFVKSRCT